MGALGRVVLRASSSEVAPDVFPLGRVESDVEKGRSRSNGRGATSNEVAPVRPIASPRDYSSA